jgi:hypothetical protein
MDELKAEVSALRAMVSELVEDANRKNDYLHGLRDCLGALAVELTGKQPTIVLLPPSGDPRKWTPHPAGVVWD